MSTSTNLRSIRVRLALLSASLFLAAGTVIVLVNYVGVQRNLNARVDTFETNLPEPGAFTVLEPAPDRGPRQYPIGPGPVDAQGRTPQEVIEDASAAFRDQMSSDLIEDSLRAVALVTLASAAVGWAVAGRLLRPIAAITGAARRLSGENLHERIALVGPDDELKELADTFDAMLYRLDAAFESHRRFVANASHELRTPLAVMRAEAEVALADPATSPEQLREMAERVRDATARTDRLVEGLLVLARSDRGLAETVPVELAEVAGGIVTQLTGHAAAAGVRLEHDLEPACVAGDAPLLDRLVGNLVDNAIAYNQPDGWVRVTTRPAGDRAVVEVVNTGPVVAPDQVTSLFEPFRRLAERTSHDAGVGLGLSIVRSIATAHGGAVDAEARSGGGLHVTVALPRAGATVRPQGPPPV